MTHLATADFLKQVTSLLDKNAGKSSIYITQKRLSYDVDSEIDGAEPFDDLGKDVTTSLIKTTPSTKEYKVLIRVTDGAKDKSKKVKLTTVVEAKDLSKFWSDYTTVIKSGFSGLKRKSKKSKRKAKKAA